MVKAFKAGRCKRCCNPRYFTHKYINNVWPTIIEAPEPSVIIWKNLATGTCSRFFRSLFIWIISIILMLGSFAIVIVSKYVQNTNFSSFGTSDCGSIEITKDQAQEDYYLPADEQSEPPLMNCYCYNQFKLIA